MSDSKLVLGSASGGLASGLASILAGLCCAGPSSVALLGVGGALAASTIAPYRLALLLLSLALIGFGLWRAYRPMGHGATSAACPMRAGRLTRGVLWLSAAVWLVAALLPST